MEVRLDDEVSTHLATAALLARDAGLDLVGVGHVVAAMLARSPRIRALISDADALRTSVLERLGRGDGRTVPMWSPRLRAVLERAHAGKHSVDERRLLAAIASEAEGVVAEVMARIPALSVELASVRVGPPTPTLDRYGRNLIAQAQEGRIHAAFGRELLFERLIIGLARHTKPHLILVGEPGVGKTALAEGLAVRVARREVPAGMETMRLVAIEPAALQAGASYRGDVEHRIRAIIDEAIVSQTTLFIDEIHGLLAVGSPGLTAADVLKPVLSRGDIRVIGATTSAGYDRFVARDAALARRFERIDVEEPDADESLEIVRGLRSRLEHHHGLSISDAALAAAVDLGRRFLPDLQLPDKAIDVLDDACARVRWAKRDRVGPDDVAHATALRAGVALTELTQLDRKGLGALEARLASRIVGQPEAIRALSNCVVRSRVGLKVEGRPVGAVLLWGPSGVGKTALAEAIAEEAFGGNAFYRIDLAEFTEGHQVARLLGAPPGYIGYEDEGLLTGWLARRPHSVVLLDEVDKAHVRVREMLLGLLDAGRLTDGRGRTVHGEHALFVLTGAGARNEASSKLGPELVTRLDAIVTMAPLGPPEYLEIARHLVAGARDRLSRARVTLEVNPSVLAELAAEGRSDIGARAIRRSVERVLVDPIARMLLERSGPLRIEATVKDGTVVLVA